jgi:hypothetical protein
MSMKRVAAVSLLLGLGAAGCQKGAETGGAQARASLRELAGDRIEVLPGDGQLPYCLAFTRSATGVLRQLTMTHENRSVRCAANEPVGKVSYRIPVDEGQVQVLLFLSDQKLMAGSVAQQLYELPQDQRPTPMNLRLPGQVRVETLAFTPRRDPGGTVGGVVQPGGEVTPATTGLPPPTDGGVPTPLPAGTPPPKVAPPSGAPQAPGGEGKR